MGSLNKDSLHKDFPNREVLEVLDREVEVEQLQVSPLFFIQNCIRINFLNDTLGIGTGEASQNGVSATGTGIANAQNGGFSISNGQGQASNLFGQGPQASGTGNGISVGK